MVGEKARRVYYCATFLAVSSEFHFSPRSPNVRHFFGPHRMALHHIPHRTKKLPPLRVGIGGPVGSGKTTLLEMLCKTMREKYDLVAITNDIYTKEDQRLLTVSGALPAERIMGVETGGCPHTAIREDASINLEAVDRMLARFRMPTWCSSNRVATILQLRSVRNCPT